MVAARSSASAVVVEGVTKRFGTTIALAGVDLDVAEGTVFGLLGPNGAGKTNVGSPAEIVEQVLAQRELFGEYQRQLFAVELGGLPERTVHEQLDFIGSDVLPVLRRELAAVPPVAPHGAVEPRGVARLP
jgi:ABC-type uncharacterized transport system ATPase subunit